MTYREVFAAIKGDHVRRRRDRQAIMWGQWHGAAFARSKRLPNLGALLRKLEPLRIMSAKQLRNAVISMAKSLGAKVIVRKKGEG